MLTLPRHHDTACMVRVTSNLSKAHVMRDSRGPATLAISVGLRQ